MPSPANDDFFVGLPADAPGITCIFAPNGRLLLVTALTGAGLIASRQRDPGARTVG